MPVGYLLSVAVVALGTLFALVPPRRSRALSALGFRLGLLLNEVPVIGCYWLIGWTLLAFAQGNIATPGAWAAVGLAALTVVGLVVVARRGSQAGPVVERALAEGLGQGRRAAVGAGPVGRVDGRRLARFLLVPLLRRRHGVVRVANLSYGDAGRRNLLDVYHHRSRPAGGPVLIHLHGGRFRGGRKNTQSLSLLHRLAARGWVCVSADYRLQPAARHPDHLVDLKKVIAWVREHGPEYGADPAVVFVAGSSAGGHLAAFAALTPNDPAFQPGFEDADTSVTAAVCLNAYLGPYDGQGADTSPAAHVRSDAPPFLIVHGDRDSVVPAAGARHFAATLRAVSTSPVVHAELPGGQHAFDLFPSYRFETVVDAVESFAAWVLKNR
ncbi:alpha/beta hydrolase [Streptomyces sp. SL13]|uniref:Alpha/beta hydrolase n=1 Tax=Streptantibioticus silvisoli TaxID=2705255 RepID=A0AA90H9V4_9ACTN|nr:alpha/beta hydrolase [Streptantibioticus silvisoli]MDI5966830.1 alpha/beta hydrolase [Streptantibioticus silvisoli]MDI5973885.1 alpha/beta hydrolase [Streptantibioticus silvisoli]